MVCASNIVSLSQTRAGALPIVVPACAGMDEAFVVRLRNSK